MGNGELEEALSSSSALPLGSCKIPNCSMASTQGMFRTQAGAAANENLDVSAARVGKSLGRRAKSQPVAGFSGAL